jgi:hypothetical protein
MSPTTRVLKPAITKGRTRASRATEEKRELALAAAVEDIAEFLRTCGVKEDASRALALENALGLNSMMDDVRYSHTFLTGFRNDEVPAFVHDFFGLEAALGDSAQIAETTNKLAAFYLGARAAISAAQSKPDVRGFRKALCEYVTKYADGNKSFVLDNAACWYSVTIRRLMAAKNDGSVMGVFSPGMGDYLLRRIPALATMLEHIITDIDKLRSSVLALCPKHGIDQHGAGLLCDKILEEGITLDDLRVGKRTPIPGTEDGTEDGTKPKEYIGVMGAFRLASREDLLTNVPAAQEVLEHALAELEQTALDALDGYDSPAPTVLTREELFLLTCAPHEAALKSEH